MKHYPLTLTLSLLIWVVCLIPIPETPLDEISFIDKWTHFVMYGGLTIVLLWERQKNKKDNSAALSIPATLALPIAQGILVEFAQAYLTTCRSGDWFDAVCNTLGVFTGAAVFRIGKLARKQEPSRG